MGYVVFLPYLTPVTPWMEAMTGYFNKELVSGLDDAKVKAVDTFGEARLSQRVS